nr:MAG TPA: hypothetical protein [Caudoviricetes sp.]
MSLIYPHRGKMYGISVFFRGVNGRLFLVWCGRVRE